MLKKWTDTRDSDCYKCYNCDDYLKKHGKPREIDLMWCDKPGGSRKENCASAAQFWTTHRTHRECYHHWVWFEIGPVKWQTSRFGFGFFPTLIEVEWSTQHWTFEQYAEFLKTESR